MMRVCFIWLGANEINMQLGMLVRVGTSALLTEKTIYHIEDSIQGKKW